MNHDDDFGPEDFGGSDYDDGYKPDDEPAKVMAAKAFKKEFVPTQRGYRHDLLQRCVKRLKKLGVGRDDELLIDVDLYLSNTGGLL